MEQRRASSPALGRAINDLVELYESVARLPRLDLSCQLRLPRLLGPELERLRSAIAGEDDEEIQLALPGAMARVDTVFVRADLARAVIALREAGRVTDVVPPPPSWTSTARPTRWYAPRSRPPSPWTAVRPAPRRVWCWPANPTRRWCRSTLICPCSTMFRIDAAHLAWVLEHLVAGEVVNRITVDEATAASAKVALERMLAIV